MAEETLPQWLLRSYRRYGDKKVAMREKDYGIWQEYTWKDYYQNVKYFCLGLISMGFSAGDKLSILGGTEPEAYWAALAAQAAGGITIGIFPDCMPPEVKYFVEHSESKFLVCEDQEQVDKALEIKEELPHLKKIIYWDPKGLWFYDDPMLMSFSEVQEQGKRYEAEHPGSFEEMVERGRGDDIAAIGYTSGTTGLPKGALLTHQNLLVVTHNLHKLSPVKDRDELFIFIPPAWPPAYWLGLGWGLVSGAALNMPEKPETMMEDFRAIGPHICAFVPRHWELFAGLIKVKIADSTFLKRVMYNWGLKIGYKMVEFTEKKKKPPIWLKVLFSLANFSVLSPLKDKLGLARIRSAFTGGTAISPDMIRFFRALGVNLKNFYGISECGFVTITRDDDVRFDSIGPLVDGVEVKISEKGELLVKSPAVFQGYYKNPEATAKALGDGWYHTGDACYMDKDGHIIYLDRVDELQELADGAKFAPQFTEVRLRFSPYIRDALVVGNQRPYVTAIINIDFENVGKWAETRRIAYTTLVDLSQKPEVRELVREEIRGVNRVLPEAARIKKFVNLHKDFDPDEAEMTRTAKLKRGLTESRYKELIDSMYSGEEQFEVKAQVKYRDGRIGWVTTEIKVNSVE